jgi:hypothetical protein
MRRLTVEAVAFGQGGHRPAGHRCRWSAFWRASELAVALRNRFRPRRNESRQRIESRTSLCRPVIPKPAGRQLEPAANCDFGGCMAERQYKTGSCRSDLPGQCRRSPKPAARCRRGGRSAPAGFRPFIHSFVDERSRRQGRSRPTTAPVASELAIPTHCCHRSRQIGHQKPAVRTVGRPLQRSPRLALNRVPHHDRTCLSNGGAYPSPRERLALLRAPICNVSMRLDARRASTAGPRMGEQHIRLRWPCDFGVHQLCVKEERCRTCRLIVWLWDCCGSWV